MGAFLVAVITGLRTRTAFGSLQTSDFAALSLPVLQASDGSNIVIFY